MISTAHSHRFEPFEIKPPIDSVRPTEESNRPGTVYTSCLKPVRGIHGTRHAWALSGLGLEAVEQLERCVHTCRRISAGQHLYRTGDCATTLYAVRTGFIKTVIFTDDGREQMTGFSMIGDFVGFESLAETKRSADAIALEETQVWEIPLDAIAELVRRTPPLQKMIYSIMEQEIQRQRSMMLVLGTLRAEERVAWFLLDLGRRYQARGFSASSFVLRITRRDLGSYLGLRLETVSRLLSRLQKEGVLRVSNKSVQIIDRYAIGQLAGSVANGVGISDASGRGLSHVDSSMRH